MPSVNRKLKIFSVNPKSNFMIDQKIKFGIWSSRHKLRRSYYSIQNVWFLIKKIFVQLSFFSVNMLFGQSGVYHFSSEIIYWQLLQKFGDLFLVTLARSMFFVVGLAPIVQWIRLRLPSCSHRSESKHHSIFELCCEKDDNKQKERQQHPELSSSLASKYYPGPMLTNFSDLTRTGVFNMVWSLTKH